MTSFNKNTIFCSLSGHFCIYVFNLVIFYFSGYYVYPHLREGHAVGENLSGRLVGPQLSAGGGDQCLAFWYSIEGKSLSWTDGSVYP